MTAANETYLVSVQKQFVYYKMLGEKAMLQLEESQLFQTVNENTNSIAVIVKHLSGNMLSRWTDFLTSDGEKDWRDRDSEFENTYRQKSELMAQWEKGWLCFFKTLDELQPDDMMRIIYIRHEGHTVVEAINRQLAHYAYHVGQIVFYAKLLKTSNWDSLSIPKNHSKNYNEDKFAKDKIIKHFTDEELEKFSDDIK